MSLVKFGKARCLACFVGHEWLRFFSGMEVTCPLLFWPHHGCAGSLPVSSLFFRDFSRALMHTPSPSIETPFIASYTKNSLLLCVHCIFKKQMSELKKVNGVIFFFFLSSKHFRISIMKNWRKLFTSLYGMNRKLSERLFWSLFVYSPFLPFFFFFSFKMTYFKNFNFIEVYSWFTMC